MIDARGIVTHECPLCGSNVFRVGVVFEDFDVALWQLDGECAECGALVTVPCPADKA
jgi:hypothetical protein